LSLNVIIVGAGISGLSTAFLLGRAGHRVTVLEAASELGDIGAGIQLTPSMSRLLIRWGAGERLKAVAVVPQGACMRRCMCDCRRNSIFANNIAYLDHDGEVVGWKQWGDSMKRDHGAPYYNIHVGFAFRSGHSFSTKWVSSAQISRRYCWTLLNRS